MKASVCSALLLSASILPALFPAHSQAGEDSGVYFNADLGGTVAESTRLKEFPDAPPGGKVEFHPGVRLGMGAGYRFNDWLSAGGETGFLINGVKGADISLTQVPLLANVEFRMPNKSPLVPFIGGGPGVSVSVLSLDNDRLNNGSRVDGSTSDTVFAWQAYGGVRYKINDNMSVGVAYKYFGADAPTWDVRNTPQDIRFGKARVHSITASFSMGF